MTHKYSAKKTKHYFDTLAGGYFSAHAFRDEIFLELILPKYKGKKSDTITALDFGCGGGGLLLKMLKLGVKAKGVEKGHELFQLAQQRLEESGFDKGNIIEGSIKELDTLPKNSFDFIILMGVLQYLSPGLRSELYAKIHRLLKPGGHMVATFQNALFDMFTFNKYTVNFFEEHFFKPLALDKKLGPNIVKDLESLITNPGKPDYSPKIARDNIYVKTTNPLTIGDELANYKLKLLQKYFYSFFPLPRLLENKYDKNQLGKFKKQFEVKRSTEWYGHF
ncbi:MAG: class I SAM-dependent methyltransferase, partial [bacterium]|nr:class I SAM-dependent methyltransferase [bacterium]